MSQTVIIELDPDAYTKLIYALQTAQSFSETWGTKRDRIAFNDLEKEITVQKRWQTQRFGRLMNYLNLKPYGKRDILR